MKNILLGAIFISLFYMGCSTNTLIKDFPSKKEFYADFNNSVSKEKVNITLTNDSSFIINNAVIIVNDTLFKLGRSEKTISNISIAKLDLDKINYIDTDYKSAFLILKNGNEIKVNNIIITRDSILASQTNELLQFSYLAPINNIKAINFKDKYTFNPLGIISGGILGYIIGRLWVTNVNKSSYSDQNNNYYLIYFAGPLLGMMAEFLISYFIGSQHYYRFND